jgi:hypothetical protein
MEYREKTEGDRGHGGMIEARRLRGSVDQKDTGRDVIAITSVRGRIRDINVPS